MSAPPAQALSTWAADCQKSAVRLAALAFRSSDWSASRMAEYTTARYVRMAPGNLWGHPDVTRGRIFRHARRAPVAAPEYTTARYVRMAPGNLWGLGLKPGKTGARSERNARS